ncbi:hypothetical protein OO012_01425 [Rhodobacteraceae bacterium KMM 6894]|nr:hypothetical protein [Rhodobacteraceae bacterium KMM 6894]
MTQIINQEIEKISSPTRQLQTAIDAIDEAFGAGYARDNPGLVAAMVQSGTIHTAVATGRSAHDDALSMAQSLTAQVCETLLRLKPRFFG